MQHDQLPCGAAGFQSCLQPQRLLGGFVGAVGLVAVAVQRKELHQVAACDNSAAARAAAVYMTEVIPAGEVLEVAEGWNHFIKGAALTAASKGRGA